MTSQMEADQLLEEHRAVWAALIKNNISCPTEDQYEAVLDALRGSLSCPDTSLEFASPLSDRF